MIVSATTPLGAARERERGQILVLFAFVLIALLLISALAVDYGGWLLARRSYQNIADEAAVAGAYLLTNPTGDDCDQGPGISKQHCAREAAWSSIKAHTGLSLVGTVSDMADNFAGVTPYSEAGYRIWVASPPSDAGAAYTGFASSNKTVFVRVERDLSANLSRIVTSSQTVGAWATAGRIPENFAIILLCRTGCLAGGADLQVAGTGSNLILESGDLGSNSYGKTSGNSASIALCEGSPTTSACSAYMNQPSQCTTTSPSCTLDRWDGTAVDTSTRYSALALPQVIDPSYQLPSLSSSTTPYQCYSTTDTPPAISFVPPQTAGDDPFLLAAAKVPAQDPAVGLTAAWPPSGTGIYGQVSDATTSTGVNAITMTATNQTTLITYTTTTSTQNGQAGRYSFTTLPAGTYTVLAHDAAGAYGDLQYTNNVVLSTKMLSLNFSLTPNPGTINGTVTGTVSGSMTISTSNGASTTISSTGPYTIASVAPGANIVVTPTPPGGYLATPTSRTITVGAGQTVNSVDFAIAAVPTGTIAGTITDDTTGLPLFGVTVTITSTAGGSTTTTTNASGAYSVGGLQVSSPNPKYTVAASKTAWESASQNNVSVANGATTTVNESLWPANCGKGGSKGDWDCDANPSGTGCYTVSPLGSTGATITCSAYDNSNLIRPGTYSNITIGNNKCAWIDPLGGRQGLTSGQKGGVVYVTDTLSIGSNAFIFGDGVTIVLGPDAHADVGNSGGFVINYDDPVNTYNNADSLCSSALAAACHWRTATYMGGRYEGGSGIAQCADDPDGSVDFRKSAWSTKARYTWDLSTAVPCYQDGDTEPYLTNQKGEIGIAWYMKGDPNCCGGHRFSFSGQMGFLFDGVLYAPKDDVTLGGQGAQAAAGQIVAWTLKYHGDTDIHQKYAGLEVDGPPYLIEPYIGE